MKQAAALYHTLTTNIRKAYAGHPAFTGRKPLFQLAVLICLALALSIISYSSIVLFS